ncbi:MAG: hypothetical protein MUP68_12095, partial [Deltaproteobacteria bacterium]|nr:hypothetical protein [Deltaproteobacteria bacterium]
GRIGRTISIHSVIKDQRQGQNCPAFFIALQTQVIDLGLKPEAISKGNFPLDYPRGKEYFFDSCFVP